MSAPEIPVFDTESPDAAILEAYEKVRQHRAWFARQLQIERENDPGLATFAKETEAVADASLALENELRGACATTPAGVAAQIIFSIFDRGGEAWAETGLFEQGLRALHQERHRLEGADQAIIEAAYSLLHIEFEQAFEAWQSNEANLSAILKVKGAIDDLKFAARHAGENEDPRLLHLESISEEVEDRFGGNGPINRLMRTLAPDFACYARKAKVMIEQDYCSAAGPWLLRDVNFLMGEIRSDEAQPERAAA